MHLIILIEILVQLFFIHHVITTNKPRYWVLILIFPVAGILSYALLEFFPEKNRDASFQRNDASHNINESRNLALSYITQGKLFHKADTQPVTQIHSPFGLNIIRNTVKLNQKNEWKTKGSGTHFGGSTLWGIDNIDTDAIRVFITSVAKKAKDNTFFYFLESDATGGLFEYDSRSNEEKRLFHKENFNAKDLDYNEDTDEFVFTRTYPNGTSNLMIVQCDGNGLREITEGDSIDEAPSWMPDKKRCIVFQSSGIARSAKGYSVGRGPSSIQALDLEGNRLTPVFEDERYDFMQPRISKDGYFYYIRRPYDKPSYNPATVVTDFIFFPFRLLRAVFHYLNFFSLVYSNKPLTTASGPKIKGDDLKTIMIKGKKIDAEKALRKGTRINGVPSLVPSNWELVRRRPDHSEEIVARHVSSFDIAPDGSVIYSNGCGIFSLSQNNKPVLLLKDNLIEDVKIG